MKKDRFVIRKHRNTTVIRFNFEGDGRIKFLFHKINKEPKDLYVRLCRNKVNDLTQSTPIKFEMFIEEYFNMQKEINISNGESVFIQTGILRNKNFVGFDDKDYFDNEQFDNEFKDVQDFDFEGGYQIS